MAAMISQQKKPHFVNRIGDIPHLGKNAYLFQLWECGPKVQSLEDVDTEPITLIVLSGTMNAEDEATLIAFYIN